LESLVIRSLVCAVLALFALASVAQAQAPDPQNTLVIELKTGRVLIKLRPDLAPKHVERAKTLAKQGFYDGIKFHRVIEGMEHVDKITRGEPPRQPDVMQKVYLLSDAKK
jgi:peptidylprolyl isomerase